MLELIDNQIDQATGTIKLKATFPNAQHQLWPGGFTNVRLLLTTRENALVVPSPAVQRGPQSTYVFIYTPEEGKVEMRPVKLAMTEGADAVIEDGLADGEQVVTGQCRQAARWRDSAAGRAGETGGERGQAAWEEG